MITTTDSLLTRTQDHSWPRKKLVTDPVFVKALQWGVFEGLCHQVIKAGQVTAAKKAINQVEKLADSYFQGPDPIVKQRGKVLRTEFKRILQLPQAVKPWESLDSYTPVPRTLPEPVFPNHPPYWLAVLEALPEMTNMQLCSWIKPLILTMWTPERVVLTANSAYHRDQVLKHYKSSILAAIKTETGWSPKLEVTVCPA